MKFKSCVNLSHKDVSKKQCMKDAKFKSQLAEKNETNTHLLLTQCFKGKSEIISRK